MVTAAPQTQEAIDALVLEIERRMRRDRAKVRRRAERDGGLTEVERSGASMAARLFAARDALSAEDAKYERWFRRQHIHFFGPSLDAIWLANLCGSVLNRRSGAEWAQPKRKPRLEALRQLQARSAVVVDEVLLLLRGGYPSGALARWRTLHEIEVTARLLAGSGHVHSERYLATVVLDLERELRQGDLGFDANSSDKEEAQLADTIVRRANAMRQRFGAEIGAPNGWAAKLLPPAKKGGRRRITFRDLEERVALDGRRGGYRAASQLVHDSQTGNLGTLRTDSPGQLFIGRRFTAAARPAAWTAWSASAIVDLFALELFKTTGDDESLIWNEANLELTLQSDRLLREADEAWSRVSGERRVLPDPSDTFVLMRMFRDLDIPENELFNPYV